MGNFVSVQQVKVTVLKDNWFCDERDELINNLVWRIYNKSKVFYT